MFSPKSPKSSKPNCMSLNITRSSFLFSPKLSNASIVEPPEFEKYILDNHPLSEDDPESKLLEFPDDDIEVTKIPRQHRTVHPYIPKDPG